MSRTISEQIAALFHKTYEELAPNFGYETREASRTEWDNVPKQNKQLMIAVVDDLITKRVIWPGFGAGPVEDQEVSPQR